MGTAHSAPLTLGALFAQSACYTYRLPRRMYINTISSSTEKYNHFQIAEVPTFRRLANPQYGRYR